MMGDNLGMLHFFYMKASLIKKVGFFLKKYLQIQSWLKCYKKVGSLDNQLYHFFQEPCLSLKFIKLKITGAVGRGNKAGAEGMMWIKIKKAKIAGRKKGKRIVLGC